MSVPAVCFVDDDSGFNHTALDILTCQACSADLSLPSVVTTICQDAVKMYNRTVASRFASLTEFGESKPEIFCPTGGGTDSGATLAHVTVAHQIDKSIRDQVYNGNQHSFILVNIDINTHCGHFEQGGTVTYGKAQESHFREARAACGAIVGMLSKYDPNNGVHARLRADLGEENFEFLTTKKILADDGSDVTCLIAAAIIAVQGMKNTLKVSPEESRVGATALTRLTGTGTERTRRARPWTRDSLCRCQQCWSCRMPGVLCARNGVLNVAVAFIGFESSRRCSTGRSGSKGWEQMQRSEPNTDAAAFKPEAASTTEEAAAVSRIFKPPVSVTPGPARGVPHRRTLRLGRTSTAGTTADSYRTGGGSAAGAAAPGPPATGSVTHRAVSRPRHWDSWLSLSQSAPPRRRRRARRPGSPAARPLVPGPVQYGPVPYRPGPGPRVLRYRRGTVVLSTRAPAAGPHGGKLLDFSASATHLRVKL
eukprot:764750-Hanusia_phi.AAC.1